jgi:hypothetical protein
MGFIHCFTVSWFWELHTQKYVTGRNKEKNFTDPRYSTPRSIPCSWDLDNLKIGQVIHDFHETFNNNNNNKKKVFLAGPSCLLITIFEITSKLFSVTRQQEATWQFSPLQLY